MEDFHRVFDSAGHRDVMQADERPFIDSESSEFSVASETETIT